MRRRAGLQTFREDPVNIVVTDIRMPGMDGVEMVKAIEEMNERQRSPTVTGFSWYQRGEKPDTG
ncbi:response regulator [Geomonas sp. RF6]|uniref:response regulator n=1 Tax=Geomonas sp. RF6 TaxID=2897342 RepID=UPI0022AAB2E2|nr:response regulator [Geomonas sp. RF6]